MGPHSVPAIWPRSWRSVRHTALVLTALSVLLTVSAMGASTELPSVLAAPASALSCGDTVAADLTLIADLDCTGYTGTVLTVGADNITIDGDGHRVIAPDATLMVLSNGYDNVTITDIDLSGADNGVTLIGGAGCTVSHTDVSDSSTAESYDVGIKIVDGTDNRVDQVVAHNRAFGVSVVGASIDTVIRDSDLSQNEYGVWGGGNTGSGARVVDNSLTYSGKYAVWFEEDHYLEISGNDLANSVNGVLLKDLDGTLPMLSLGSSPGAVSGVALALAWVDNMTVTGLDLSYSGGTPSGHGLQIYAGSGNVVRGITVHNRGAGIAVFNDSDGNTIEGNILSGNDHGVLVGGALVDGTQVLNNDLANSWRWGVSATRDHTLFVSGNDFSGSANGVFLSFLDSTMPTLNFDATMADVEGTALSLSFVSNMTVSGLDLSGSGPSPGSTGLSLYDSHHNVVDGLTVHGRDVGVRVFGTGNKVRCGSIQDGDVGVKVASGSVNSTVEYNLIGGNASHGLSNDAADEVDAEHNFWGANDGPAPTGSGDAVIGNVDYEPYAETVEGLDLACSSVFGGAAVAVDALVDDGTLNQGEGNALKVKLKASKKQHDKGKRTPAVKILGAFKNHVGAMVSSGRLTPAQAMPLYRGADRAIAAIETG